MSPEINIWLGTFMGPCNYIVKWMRQQAVVLKQHYRQSQTNCFGSNGKKKKKIG